jgi:hypothetical protein
LSADRQQTVKITTFFSFFSQSMVGNKIKCHDLCHLFVREFLTLF